jgi:hypothetical protein
MPDADIDANVDYFVANYRKGEYADRLLDEEFINESFAQLDASFETLYANRFLFGIDRTTTTQDGVTAVTHYNGIKDLIANAAASTAITAIDGLDVLSTTTVAKNIQLPSTLTDVDCFSQINNLMYKMSQINTVFTFGSKIDSATPANSVF